MSVAGVGTSIWAQAVSLAGVDPQSIFQKLWLFQLVLFFLLMPLGVQAVRYGVHSDPLDCLEWNGGYLRVC
jgi:hypothetical protein